MAEPPSEAGEVAGLAVVAGREGVPEHVRLAHLGGDLGAGADPDEEVLGDVVDGATPEQV